MCGIIGATGGKKLGDTTSNKSKIKFAGYKFALIYVFTLLIAFMNLSCENGNSSSGSTSPGQRADTPVPLQLNAEVDSDGDGYANAYDIAHLDEEFYISGNGSGNAPYLIQNIYQLQAIAGVDHTGVPLNQSIYTNFRWLYGSNKTSQLESDYVLGNDIDASITNTWRSVQVNATLSIAGFTPIGDCDTTLNCFGTGKHAYRGKFSGGANSINNLHITRGASSRLGLFGLTGTDSEISSISLTNLRVNGLESVGGLVGENFGRIYSAEVTGRLAGYLYVGILAGRNRGLISSSSVTGSAYGDLSIGGFVGDNSGRTEFCSADVFVRGGNVVGGLIGFNRGDIYDCFVNGDVRGISGVGDFTGINLTPFNAFGITGSSLQKEARGSEDVGGLVGVNHAGAEVSYSQAFASVTGNFSVGGLIGLNQGDVFLSSAEGNVSGENSVGGVSGQSSGVIAASSFVGNVSGDNQVGGLVGFASGNITHSYVLATVSGQDKVGGLAGEYNQVSGIAASYAIAEINTQEPSSGSIGGLVGDHLVGLDTDSYWEGEEFQAASYRSSVGRLSKQQIRRCGYGIVSLLNNPADRLLCRGIFTSTTWGLPIIHGNLSASWYFADQEAPPILIIQQIDR